MKKIFTIATLVFMSQCSTKPENVDFSEPTPSISTLLFSTVGGKMMILAGSKEAQLLNDQLIEEGFSLYSLNVGNAFIIDSSGTFFLYTARHLAKGLEKISRNIGADIVSISYDGLKRINAIYDISEGYRISTDVHDGDSVFVRGYISDKKGKVHSVVVRGVGILENKTKSKVKIINNHEFIQENTFLVFLGNKVDLAGLSGAPAFNKYGEVIGVYSGRNVTDQHVYYARISLFN